MDERKPFLLRIDEETLDALRRWANDDLRSLNGQIEFLLRKVLRERGRLTEPVAAPPAGGTEIKEAQRGPAQSATQSNQNPQPGSMVDGQVRIAHTDPGGPSWMGEFVVTFRNWDQSGASVSHYCLGPGDLERFLRHIEVSEDDIGIFLGTSEKRHSFVSDLSLKAEMLNQF